MLCQRLPRWAIIFMWYELFVLVCIMAVIWVVLDWIMDQLG